MKMLSLRERRKGTFRYQSLNLNQLDEEDRYDQPEVSAQDLPEGDPNNRYTESNVFGAFVLAHLFDSFMELLDLLHDNFPFAAVSGKRFYMDMYGALIMPLEFFVLVLPGVFLLVWMAMPGLILWVSYQAMQKIRRKKSLQYLDALQGSVCRPNYEATSRDLMEAGIFCVVPLASLLSICAVSLTAFAHSLRELVASNIVSGLEVCAPACLWLALAYCVTASLFEHTTARRMLVQTAEEFADLEDTSNFSSEFASNYLPTLRTLFEYFDLVNKTMAYHELGSIRPIFDKPYLASTLHSDVDCFGIGPAQRNPRDVMADMQGPACLTMANCFFNVPFPSWYCLLTVTFASFLALLSPIWMSQWHPDTYLNHESLLVRLLPIVSTISTFILINAFSFVLWTCWILFSRVHLRLALSIYLSATDVGKPFTFRILRGLLECVAVRVDRNGEVEFDFLRDDQKALGTVSSDGARMFNQELHREQLMLRRDLTLFHQVPASSKQAFASKFDFKELRVQSLNVDLFGMLRMWLKLDFTAQRIRIEHMLHGLVSCAALMVVMMLLTMIHVRDITVGTIFVATISVALVFVSLLVLNAGVKLNTVLKDLTVSMLLSWKDKLMRKRSRFVLCSQTGAIGEAELNIDRAFEALCVPIDHIIRETELALPVRFFGMPIDVPARNRIFLVLFTGLSATMWHVGVTYCTNAVENLKGEVWNSTKAAWNATAGLNEYPAEI